MRHLSIFACLILAVTASAQTTATLVTETDFGVFGKVGTTTVLRAVAKNTAIAAGVPLTLSGIGRGVAAATTVSLSNSGPTVAVKSSASVATAQTRGSAGTAATINPRSVVPAPHSVLLTINNPGFKSLDVTMRSTVVGRARAAAMVDIGADGSVEFSQVADGKVYRKTIAITGATVKVRITMTGSVTAGMGYDMFVQVAPSSGNPGCLISSYGARCPTTTLTGKDTPVGTNHVVVFKIGNALPGAPVVLVLGSMKTKVALPGSPCFLLTNELVLVGLTADAAGKASTTATFPKTIRGTGYLQAIPFDPSKGLIFASNGLRVDCL